MTNTDKPLTTTEAAKALGIPRSTLKNWLRELPLGAQRDTQGDWRIPPGVLEALGRVHQLRTEDGRSLASIRVILAPGPAGDEPTTDTAEPAPNTGRESAEPVADTGPTTAAEERLVAAVTLAVERQAGIAMELAKLAHTNGKLEAEVGHLRAQLAASEAKVAQLQAAKEKPRSARPWWRIWGVDSKGES